MRINLFNNLLRPALAAAYFMFPFGLERRRPLEQAAAKGRRYIYLRISGGKLAVIIINKLKVFGFTSK